MCVNYFQAKIIGSKFDMLPMKWKKIIMCLQSSNILQIMYIKHCHFFLIEVLCHDFVFSKISLILHIFTKIFQKFHC